jgi:hypothetical protein
MNEHLVQNETFGMTKQINFGMKPTMNIFSSQELCFAEIRQLELTNIELLSDKKNTNRRDAKFKINIKISKDKQLYETFEGLNERLFYPYCSMLTYSSALHTNIYVKYKENLLEKFDYRLPMNENELQKCSIAFKSLSDNDLTLKKNWKVIRKEDTEVILNLQVNKFEQIDLNKLI